MKIKYPNSENSHIFKENLNEKLEILKTLTSVSEGAQKYYDAIISPINNYTDKRFYTRKNLLDILKIENTINLLTLSIDFDLIFNHLIQNTTHKLKQPQNQIELNDCELFGIIKECKNKGIPKDLTQKELNLLLNEVTNSVYLKEKEAYTYILSKINKEKHKVKQLF